jgi:hypothetical protein
MLSCPALSPGGPRSDPSRGGGFLHFVDSAPNRPPKSRRYTRCRFSSETPHPVGSRSGYRDGALKVRLTGGDGLDNRWVAGLLQKFAHHLFQAYAVAIVKIRLGDGLADTVLGGIQTQLRVHEKINSQFQALRRFSGKARKRRNIWIFRAFATQPGEIHRRIKCEFIFE